MRSAAQLIAGLKRCSKLRDLEAGKLLHREAAEAGVHNDKYVAATLITMYSRCRSMDQAREIFDRMTLKNVVVWNTLILGYVENGNSSLALDFFGRIDCQPSSVTYMAALKACIGLASEKGSGSQLLCLEKGIEIHKQMKVSGLDSNLAAATTLVDMYSKCGSMKRAREVFDGMSSRDAVTWNSLILGYVENGESSIAMDLFLSMDCEPSSVTYVAALKACGGLGRKYEAEKQRCLENGIYIHEQVRARGFESDMVVATSLVDMYSSCGSMDKAREVFDGMHSKDVIAWNNLILGYIANAEGSLALDAFSSMDCQPNAITYVAALKACGALASEQGTSDKQKHLEKGIEIHKQVKDHCLDFDLVAVTTLVDMYCKCGSMQHAREVFDRMNYRNAFAWTSLILGYVEDGQSSVALDLFTRMDCEPDCITYVAALKACSNLAALRPGQQIHAVTCNLGLEQDQMVATSLVDLYGKCGSMSKAEELFNNLRSPVSACWNSLIAGYSSFGDSSQVFGLARKMQEAGLQMDAITSACVLSACSHAGLVQEGKRFFFDSMPRFGISPNPQHYNCMIDMLGRANRLQEALALVQSMPFGASSIAWRTLLAACRKWNNVEVGKIAFDALVAADKRDGSAYVLLSDIYGSRDLEQTDAKQQMRESDMEAVQKTYVIQSS